MTEPNKRKVPSPPAKPRKKIKAGVTREPRQVLQSAADAAAAAHAPSSASGTVAATVATTATTMKAHTNLKERVIEFLSKPEHKKGVFNKKLEEHVNADAKELAEVINRLLKDARLTIQMSKEGGIWYTLRNEEDWKKRIGLEAQQLLVLQAIEESGNQGIWTKDIRMQTNIQQQALTKIFRTLEQRQLIKPVKSVTAKAKKLYMMYDLTPSKELTGGVWYSGLEIDDEFITSLRVFIERIIEKHTKTGGITLESIHQMIQEFQVSKVDLSIEDVQQVVQTLVYDKKIEEEERQLDGQNMMTNNRSGSVIAHPTIHYVKARNIFTTCDFQWWDVLAPDFHFRTIVFEDGIKLHAHEFHYHT